MFEGERETPRILAMKEQNELLQARVDDLEGDVTRLRAALELYANPDAWCAGELASYLKIWRWQAFCCESPALIARKALRGEP